MRVRSESVTHLVVKLFNVKSKFDYIDKNKKKPSAELNPIPRVLKLKKDVNKKKPLRLPYWD
jgi:hypothetical protein